MYAIGRAQRRPGHAPRRHHGRTSCPSGAYDVAQRRPGHAPRRHVPVWDRLHSGSDRSTKAGARTPATPDWIFRMLLTVCNAQRRPGHAPRRHAETEANKLLRILAQRRPGHAPRRHPPPHFVTVRIRYRSTKAGARTPATRADGSFRAVYDDARSTKAGARTPATRRRLHKTPADRPRSTKAGARTPATLAGPRRALEDDPARSTKAGARTPATRAKRCSRMRRGPALNEGRGTHPGDTMSVFPPHTDATALNEGRGTHPGDTRAGHADAGWHVRSTKAGARTPATRRSALCSVAPMSAQRRPGHAPRRHLDDPLDRLGNVDLRSTKAGARTPATLLSDDADHTLPTERSTKAGARTPATLGLPVRWSKSSTGAQRRPGHAPRRHRRAMPAWATSTRYAQRRPGHAPRRHARVRAARSCSDWRSTKAGARTPATRRPR